MEHPFLPSISFANTCVGINVPKKFKSNTNLTPLSSNAKKSFSYSLPSSCVSLDVVALGLLPPAPLIKISTLPRSAFIAFLTSSRLSFSKTLALYAFAIPPILLTSSATF